MTLYICVIENHGMQQSWFRWWLVATTANSYSQDHTLTETFYKKNRRILYYYATKFMFYRPIYFDPPKIKRTFQRSTHIYVVSFVATVLKMRNYGQAVTTTTPIIRGQSVVMKTDSASIAIPVYEISADTIVNLYSLKARSQLAYWWKGWT